MMIIKIAWRNIWRSKGRSGVVIGSIIVGVWALIASSGFTNGFMVGYVNEAINYDLSNIQIHHPEFKKDKEIIYSIKNGLIKAEEIRQLNGVKAVTTRSLTGGMIATAKKATGIQILGIDKENEARVTHLDSLIVEGAYFEGVRRNPIVIGQKLAETIKAKVRSKVVLTFNDSHGNITSAAFRVVGIVKSASLNVNERYTFILKSDLNSLLGIGEVVHEIAIIINEGALEADVIANYESAYSGDLVEDWRTLSPSIALMQDLYGNMLYVLMVIIMTALIFGIINTMLMAVLERMKELGMLMAIGMNKWRVFAMIMMETLFLAVIAAPLGLLSGYLTISYYRSVGVDLTNYSEGLESFGYASILYPYITTDVYTIVTIGVMITAFLAAIYPAWKAIKLKPVEALHKI